MRRILAGLLIGGMLATGCSGGSSPLQTVRAAAGKTTSVTSARMSMSITSASGPLAKGLMYDGAFNFAEHRGRFTVDTSSLGVPGSAGAFAVVIDASKGSVVYVKYPQISRLLPGKSWLKVDAGATITRATGVDISSLLSGQSSDPTSGLRLLAGADTVTKVGSETIRGASTTRFHVIINVDKATALAPAQTREAIRKLGSLYIAKTFPIEVWLDGQDRVRRLEEVTDPTNLRLPAQTQEAANASGRITTRIELFDFGASVDTALPPADQVADIAQLQGGGAKSATAAASPQKAAFIAKANAVCTVMNARAAALADPGSDPQKQADITSQEIVITSAALRQLRSLAAPPGDAASVASIFAKIDVIIGDATELVDALRAGDHAKVDQLTAKLDADTVAANDASNAYGLTVCGAP